MDAVTCKIRNCLGIFLLTLTIPASYGTDSTWTGNGTDAFWSNPDNWDTGDVPDTFEDSAFFSSTTAVTEAEIQADKVINVKQINFLNATTIYKINNNGTINITNDSGDSITGNSDSNLIPTITNIDDNSVLTVNSGGMTHRTKINNNGQININNDNNDLVIYSNVTISGTGDFNKTGAKNLFINSQNNTYSGKTIINNSTAQLGNSASSGNLINSNVLLQNSSRFFFDNPDITTYSNTITGKGNIIQEGSALIILTGNSEFDGITEITASSGGLQLGDNSEGGTVNTTIKNEKSLSFNHSNNITYGSVIYGAGTVTQAGSQSLTLTGENTYSGETFVNSGILQIGDAGDTGSISDTPRITIASGATLAFNRNNEVSYNGIIAGDGELLQSGDGTLILNGSSPDYNGITKVNNGILFIGSTEDYSNAELGGNVNINNNAILQGFGKIGGTLTLNDSATLSPGASIGVINVSNYTQNPETTYYVEINQAGEGDLLDVVNTADLAGTLSIDMSQGFNHDITYNVINAAIINGKFDNVTVLQPFLDSGIAYLNDGVTLSPGFSETAFTTAAQTPNQTAVANYLLATDGTEKIREDITAMTTDQEFNLLMDQISAANYADQSLQIAQIAIWFDEQMASRIQPYPQCHGISYMAMDTEPNSCTSKPDLWVVPYGGYAVINSGDVSGLDTSMGGIMLGVEFPVINKIKLGAAFGSNYFSMDSNGQENTNSEGMLYQFGLYGDYTFQQWVFGGSISLTGTDNVGVTRNINSMNELITINGSYTDSITSGQLQVRYDWQVDNNLVRPFAGLIYQNGSRDSFDENGDADFALSVPESDYNSLQSQLGVSFELTLGPNFKLPGSVSWWHQFSDTTTSLSASINSIKSNQQFTVDSVAIGSDAAHLNLGISLFEKNEIQLAIMYQGVFAAAYSENGGKIQIDFDLS